MGGHESHMGGGHDSHMNQGSHYSDHGSHYSDHGSHTGGGHDSHMNQGSHYSDHGSHYSDHGSHMGGGHESHMHHGSHMGGGHGSDTSTPFSSERYSRLLRHTEGRPVVFHASSGAKLACGVIVRNYTSDSVFAYVSAMPGTEA